MKRAIALLLSLATLLTSVGFGTVMAEEDYSYYLNFVQKLGIIDDISSPKAYITRGQFAKFISIIISDGSVEITSDRFFEESNKDILLFPSTDSENFDDVPVSNTYYTEINRVNHYGIMNGTGYRKFSPDSEIPFIHAATALVRLLGYSYKVTGNDYLAVAEGLGIYDGLSYSATDKLTTEQAARIFYNLFDINVTYAELVGDSLKITEKDNVNIYEEFMAVEKTTGQMQQNPYTSIYGDATARKGSVVINGEEYIAEDNFNFYSLIGRDVEVYYKTNDDDERIILWGYASGKDEAVTIAAEDITDFVMGQGSAKHEITYNNGDKEKSEKIEKSAAMIYNGIYKEGWDKSYFDFENGDVTIIKPTAADEFNLIVVNDYRSMKVTEINKTEKIIYGQQYYKGKISTFRLEYGSLEDWQVQYYLADGTFASFEDISKGMIIDVLTDNIDEPDFLKLIVSGNVISGVVENIDNNGLAGETTYTLDNGEKVIISESYLNALGNAAPVLNKAYNFSLNSFGKVASVENTTSVTDSSFVYVIDLRTNSQQEDFLMKYFSSKGKIETAYIKKGARVNRETLTGRESFRMHDIEDFNKITAKDGVEYSGVAQIKLDEEGLISEINLPMTDGKNRDNIFGTIVNGENKVYCRGTSTRHFVDAMFGSGMVAFGVGSASLPEEERYTLLDLEELISEPYKIWAYNFNSASVVTDVLVVDTSGMEASTAFIQNRHMYLITNIYNGLYDDEPATMIEATGFNAYEDMKIIHLPVADAVDVNNVTTYLGAYAESYDKKLKVGDVVDLKLKADKITDIKLIYRIFGEADKNIGQLVGAGERYDPENGRSTNPFAINYSAEVVDAIAQGSDNYKVDNVVCQQAARIIAGSVYNVEDDKFVTYTTQPLSGTNSGYDPERHGYLTETIPPYGRYYVCTVNGKNISIRQATMADFVPYTTAGNDCSEIMILMNNAISKNLLIINRVK